jgi:hypothetical protein
MREPRRPFIWKATGGARLHIILRVQENSRRPFNWKATERSPLAQIVIATLAIETLLLCLLHCACLCLCCIAHSPPALTMVL